MCAPCSYACSAVKYSPSSTVKNRPCVAYVALISNNPLCAHVTVTPEASKMAVFLFDIKIKGD
jgi:hypothetical protein